METRRKISEWNEDDILEFHQEHPEISVEQIKEALEIERKMAEGEPILCAMPLIVE